MEFILILIISLAFAIRTSTFQTWLANRVASYLADEWGTVVQIDEVEIIFFDSVEIKGLYAEDEHGDTLVYAEKIWVNIDDFSLKKKFFYIDDIELFNTTAYLVIHEGEEELNLNFIIDYFTPEESDTTKSDFDFRIHNFHLNNVHFVYRNENKPDIDYGMNYHNIDVRNINLQIADFSLIEDGVQAKIVDLNAQEKSGISIKSFQSEVIVAPKGIKLKGLYLATNDSKIKMEKLEFKTKRYRSWVNFEDSVKLIATIKKSEIQMLDVSYFVPFLEGFDQKITVNGKLKGNIRHLKVKKFNIKTGDHTHISGDFVIPDYKDFYNSFIDFNFEHIHTTVADIESFPLYPFTSGKHVELPSNLKGLNEINIIDGFVYGPISGDGFILKASATTGLGDIIAHQGIKINYKFEDSTFYYQGPQDPGKYASKKYDLYLNNVNLGALTGNPSFGLLDGGIFFKGKGLNKKDMSLELSGNIESLQFKGYGYQDLEIVSGKIANNQFIGELLMDEENIKLDYKGKVDFGKSSGLDFVLELDHAMLTKLNILPKDSNRLDTELSTKIYFNTKGNSINTLKGTIGFSNFTFRQDSLTVELDTLSFYLGRSEIEDSLLIYSSMIDAEVFGKFDLGTIRNSLRNQFLKIFPEYFDDGDEDFESLSRFNYDIRLKNTQPVIDLFSSKIELANNSHVYGEFNSTDNILGINFQSNLFVYGDQVYEDIVIENSAAPMQLDLNLRIRTAKLNTNLTLNNIHFTAKGENSLIHSELHWSQDKYRNVQGMIAWTTEVFSSSHFKMNFDYSQIPIRDHIWTVAEKSEVTLKNDIYEIKNVQITSKEHEILLNGILSNDPSEALNFEVNNFELKDLDDFLSDNLKLDGVLNAKGSLRNVFTNMDFNTVASIDSFQVNDELIGNVEFNQQWNNEDKSFDINGGIKRKFKQVAEEIKTFDFNGKYFLFKEENNLNLNLVFDKTDISFVNSFLPKDQISNIRGFLNGQLKMEGTLTKPIFSGKVDFQAGNAYINMLGNNFGLMGEIQSEDYGFIINHMYITDPEGNTGTVTGSIFHEHFNDWNFEALFNLTDNPFEYYTSGANNGFPKPLEKFQILNTEYKDGDYYYGIGYVTGYASVFGYANHFEINADIKTLRGTKINFPMYGSTNVSEDDFIVFKSKDSVAVKAEEVSKLKGIDLNLNFDITKETETKIIFDESTGDLIEAKGSGLINLNMNRLGELSMTGKYTIDEGKYFLSMKNLIKKDFTLRKNGTIDWTGKAYDADIDVQAIYTVKASFSEAIPDITNSDNSTSKDLVECVLKLSNSLISPQMDIDIQSPTNNESAKATLSRIKSSEDELNRQFFSLLMLQKFQPIVGSQTGGNAGVYNALGEALTGQLNSILNSIDENYNFNVNYNQDDVNKTQTYEFGMSTEVLNDRLVISGNFGLENYSGGGSQSQNNFVGDVKVEYKLNKDGSFRVNAFNESNDTRIIQDKALGQFTQGIGIRYSEEFDSVDSLKFLQYFLDLFRKDEKRRFWHKRSKDDNPKYRSIYEDENSRNPSYSEEKTTIDTTKEIETGTKQDIIEQKNKGQKDTPSPFKKEDYIEYNTLLNKSHED